MRDKLIPLVVLAAISLPAFAAKRMTIDQLQQIMAAAQTLHRTDDTVMQQLTDARITTRLTGSALQHLIAISPGPKTTQAIHAIADESAFLDPSPDELPATPAPDIATQKAIIGRTIDYVVHTLPSLPNFLATRVTEHYVDTIRGLEREVSEPRGDLFLMNTYQAPIAFRDGRETDDPALAASLASSDKKAHVKDVKGAADQRTVLGMSSWGEFGPVLAAVLIDAAKGKLGWARWQKEDGKPVAVFQFTVDRSISHYQVNYCCDTVAGTVNYVSPEMSNAAQQKSAALKPGYHGRFEIDPETGVVLRLFIEADLRPEDPIRRASMMVEYSPVKIGDSVHFCPTRSVSISISRAEFESHGELESTNRLQLNDAEFTDYHRFGSESMLITEVPTPSSQTDQTDQSAAAPATLTPGEEASAAKPEAKAEAKTDSAPAPPTMAAIATPLTPPVPVPSNAPPAEANKEISIQTLDGLPNPSESTAKAGEDTGSFTLKTTTRSVDVGLSANDKKGKPVADLKQDEINIFDNGRQQQVRNFYRVTPGAAAALSAPEIGIPDTFTNTASVQLQEAPDLLILLMDESHLAYLDLNRARGEVLRFLAATRPASRVALYSISERGFHVIQDVTQDHALVEKKLAAWTPDASAVAQAQALDRRNRQQFDTVHNAKDLDSVNGNDIDEAETIATPDPELRQMGDNPVRYALEGMIALARHFASVPGHKSIAWISGDSVLVDWGDQAVGIDKGSKQLEAAYLRTREALNEAHIALYAVDASAVEGGAIDASIQNRNVELNQVDQNGPLPRNSTDGRVTAQMQQDTRAIQSPVRQLAESTGGQAFNRGSDLKATLEGIDRDSSSFYEVGFNPDTPADGKFHTLLVKIPSRKNVSLRYRTGYLYSEESTNKQQRLQQAVWSPQDVTGIALTAEPLAASETVSGKSAVTLRIALTGLSVEQKDGHWADDLYIFVAQRDDATQKAEVSGDTLRLNLNQATYDSGMPTGIPYRHAVDAKFRLGSVRVIVVDGNSGKMGSVTLPSSAFHQ